MEHDFTLFSKTHLLELNLAVCNELRERRVRRALVNILRIVKVGQKYWTIRMIEIELEYELSCNQHNNVKIDDCLDRLEAHLDIID